MIQILQKKYNPTELEKKWQDKWKKEKTYKFSLNSGINSDANSDANSNINSGINSNIQDKPPLDKPVYSIDTPPPFTSGTLHMGHIYNHVWIDIVARYKRMRGFNVYLPQGFDCHGLPTELRVEKEFGVDKKNREEFLEECRKWTESAILRMREQFDSIGYSSDWEYTYKTMDDDYKRIVQKSLLNFYEKGLLYRKKHPVLWCTNCGTALAKAEVGHVERNGKLYHIDLDVEADSGVGDDLGVEGDLGVENKTTKLTIATSRPELMPACIAVLVHPDDDRYVKYVGKKAKLPIFDRDVPILADSAVDMEFGTGVVYVCTFGDEQDITWQKQYNLPVYEAIDKNGNMTELAGKYKGMGTNEARKSITKDLADAGHIQKIEDIKHNVLSHTERESCKTPIELLPMEQWFIKVMDFIGDIIKNAKQMNWYPEYMLGRMIDWSESMNWDWIISRQRVFGTPIPFWVCKCGEVIPADESDFPLDPRGTTKKCPKCGCDAIGEVDVCDCWVDSSMTPLIISKWGNDQDQEFFKKTYPSSVRPQGYEIIRTWTFYTIFRNMVLTKKPCFTDLMINGMVAGPDGRKMSKSLGNTIGPDEPLKKYSADALRQWAASGTQGEDFPFSWEECEHSKKFLTKLWNISRFIEMHMKDMEVEEFDENFKNFNEKNEKAEGPEGLELEKLRYTVKSEIMNSMIHGNIPQNRERIFIAGFLSPLILRISLIKLENS